MIWPLGVTCLGVVLVFGCIAEYIRHTERIETLRRTQEARWWR